MSKYERKLDEKSTAKHAIKSDHGTIELSEAELSKVSGGNLALVCCTGKHIARAKITC